jgi:hypothetical protein
LLNKLEGRTSEICLQVTKVKKNWCFFAKKSSLLAMDLVVLGSCAQVEHLSRHAALPVVDTALQQTRN